MQVERAGLRFGEWRTGEEHVDDLASSGGYRAEMRDNPAYVPWADQGGKLVTALDGGSAAD